MWIEDLTDAHSQETNIATFTSDAVFLAIEYVDDKEDEVQRNEDQIYDTFGMPTDHSVEGTNDLFLRVGQGPHALYN